MTRLLYSLLFVTIFSISGLCQSPSKVLQNAEKALGGKKALNAVTSWERTGTISRRSDGSTGSFTQAAKAPNLYHISFDLGGFETEMGYNGRSGWRRDSRDGLSTLTGKQSSDFQAEASFRNSLWLNYKKERAKISAGGIAEVNGKRANVVNYSTPRGSVIKLYFDAVTFLPLKEEIQYGDSTDTIEYEDYRAVGAVKQAHKLTLRIGEQVFDIQLDSLRSNIHLDDAVFAFPEISGKPLPDIQKLLSELQTNEDKVEDILDTYSYTQKVTRRELGKDGILRDTMSVTNQLSFYKGRRISRMVEKNGKPLSAKDQADEDKDAAKRVAEIDKEIAKEERRSQSGPPNERSNRVSIAEVLRASRLVNPRRERLKGRDVIVFDFEPNPTFDYKNAESMLKFFGKTIGVMWIDEKDKQVARLEASLADSFNIGGGLVAKLRKGASFVLEQERVNDEIWLPSSADINISVRVLLLRGINLNQIIRSYDYRKFATEVRDAAVDEIKDKN